MRNLGWVALTVLLCGLAMVGVRAIKPEQGTLSAVLSMVVGALLITAFGLATVGGFIAIVLGCCVPVRRDCPPKRGRRIFAYLLGTIGMALMALPIVVMIFFGCALFALFRGSESDVRGATLAEIEHSVPEQFRKDIPASVTDIDFHSSAAFLFQEAQFHCHISEEDFTQFATSKGYPLGTNVCINANAATNVQNPNVDYVDCVVASTAGGTPPKNFLSYAYVYTNCGGAYYIFDRDTETLYYLYSDH